MQRELLIRNLPKNIKLEKEKIITVVGSYEFRAYGKSLDAPLYDVYQLATISEDVVKNFNKGKKGQVRKTTEEENVEENKKSN